MVDYYWEERTELCGVLDASRYILPSCSMLVMLVVVVVEMVTLMEQNLLSTKFFQILTSMILQLKLMYNALWKP